MSWIWTGLGTGPWRTLTASPPSRNRAASTSKWAAASARKTGSGNIWTGRVILGTAAVTDYPFLEEMVKKYGGRIAVGVDTKDGCVATHGWLETSAQKGVDFCRRLRDSGVKTVIYTDISRDGRMQGTNLSLYEELSQIQGLDIIASGGISSLEEIVKLKDVVHGAILGKALYVGAIDLREALMNA